jgi:flagellar biogenesis protein FliO
VRFLVTGAIGAVVGVATGNVRLLWALDEPATPPAQPSVASDQIGAAKAAPHKPTFRDMLRRSLGQ